MAISITKILVPVDSSSCSITALKVAESIAGSYHAELFIHYVEESNKTADEIKAKVNEVLPSGHFQFSQSTGSVFKEITNQAQKIAANLIIMGTHGSTGFQEFWLGSNAYKVINSSKCPVLVVRDGLAHYNLRKMVLPLDTSFESRQKVPLAINLAQKLSGSIHILGVSTSKDKDAEYHINTYSRQASDSITDHKIACTIEKRLGGNITNVTINYAKEIEADLIVIMNEQEAQIGSFFLGKFAQQMVNHSSVPVLVVPTRDDLIVTEARL